MKESSKTSIIRLNELLYKEVKNLSDKQVEDILSGKAKLELLCTYSKEKQTKQTKSKQQPNSNSETNSQELVDELRNINDREEGKKFLEKVCPNKKTLVDFANQINVPTSGNTKAQIQNSIIEATIGVRLRSLAIRGKEPKKTTVESVKTKRTEHIYPKNLLFFVAFSYTNTYLKYVVFLYDLLLYFLRIS